ncbi:ATP-binding protein [Streptomyces sp. NPDC004838]
MDAVRAERDQALEALGRIARRIEHGRTGIAHALEQVRPVHIPQAPRLRLPAPTGDLGRDLDAALAHVHREARQAVVDAAEFQTRFLDGERELADIVRSIAPRLMAAVTQTLTVIDTVERAVEDLDLLHELFAIDHLVIQIRRAVESLAVLGGSTPPREAEPVLVTTVLRRAVQEIRAYQRVRVVRTVREQVALPGYATPAVVHLLADLLDNATRYSAPETQVQVRTSFTDAGLAIEVDDRGLGISPEKITGLNRLLAAPETADTRQRLVDGRIGLLVAARLAARHKIPIRLRHRAGGGTAATVILPTVLLCAPEPGAPRPATREPVPGTVGPRRAEAVPVSTGLPLRTARARRKALPGRGAGDARPPLPLRSHTNSGSAPPPAGTGPASPASYGAPTPGLAARFLSRGQHAPGSPDPRVRPAAPTPHHDQESSP